MESKTPVAPLAVFLSVTFFILISMFGMAKAMMPQPAKLGGGARMVAEWPVSGSPDYVSVDVDGNVFTTINGQSTVKGFTPEGVQFTQWSYSGEATGIASPWQTLSSMSPGIVYVSFFHNEVIGYKSDGEIVRRWVPQCDDCLFPTITGIVCEGSVVATISCASQGKMAIYDPDYDEQFSCENLESPALGVATDDIQTPFVLYDGGYKVAAVNQWGTPYFEWDLDGQGQSLAYDGLSIYANIPQRNSVVRYYIPDRNQIDEWTYKGNAAGIARGPYLRVYLADPVDQVIRVYELQ
jgi:hypothetical protein